MGTVITMSWEKDGAIMNFMGKVAARCWIHLFGMTKVIKRLPQVPSGHSIRHSVRKGSPIHNRALKLAQRFK